MSHAPVFPTGLAERLADLALAEDLVAGPDVTTLATVPADLVGTGRVVARAGGVVAGLPAGGAVFTRLLEGAGSVEVLAHDGQRIEPGEVLMVVHGPVARLLTAERSALNMLTLLSGVATLTARWVDAVAGTGAQIRDTRKTAPGLRAAQKHAVLAGGGTNHRLGLGDQALIKDNHVLAAGGVVPAIRAVRARYPDVFCEVECDTLDQVAQAVD
ncbi:MAG: carboxylating nicotinate-nucleotide diphosphorylase, partial [Actinobacteria bacterium]|nr:carboxylating nicotinate-nucleotide diphosphorylase [Actinomycetota bacterium]